MSAKWPSRVVADVDVIAFKAIPGDDDGDDGWVCCPTCEGPLELFQPDPQATSRFLGICQDCDHWYLIHAEPTAIGALMVLLPDHEWLVSLVKSRGTSGEGDWS